MAMLDLQSFQRETFEVKLFDGSVINLNKPSQRLIIELMGLEAKLNKNASPTVALNSFIEIILSILNNNAEGLKFDREYVETYFDLEIGQAFVQGFMEFANGVNSDPN